MRKLIVTVRMTDMERYVVSEANLDVSEEEARRIKKLGNSSIATQFINHIAQSCDVKKRLPA